MKVGLKSALLVLAASIALSGCATPLSDESRAEIDLARDMYKAEKVVIEATKELSEFEAKLANRVEKNKVKLEELTATQLEADKAYKEARNNYLAVIK